MFGIGLRTCMENTLKDVYKFYKNLTKGYVGFSSPEIVICELFIKFLFLFCNNY